MSAVATSSAGPARSHSSYLSLFASRNQTFESGNNFSLKFSGLWRQIQFCNGRKNLKLGNLKALRSVYKLELSVKKEFPIKYSWKWSVALLRKLQSLSSFVFSLYLFWFHILNIMCLSVIRCKIFHLFWFAICICNSSFRHLFFVLVSYFSFKQ